VTLPLWYDCYNYAQLVEYLKVGIWPAKDTAPTWEASLLSQGILRALNEPAFIRNPRRIAEAARRYNGRKGAAEVISDMANRRHSSTTG
jgi:UDP:flavonoid glycosyltransferase YjiC (YdhE family)